MKTVYELYEWNLKMRKVHDHGFKLNNDYIYDTRSGNSFAIKKEDFSTGIKITVGEEDSIFFIEKIVDGSNYTIEDNLSFKEAKIKSIAYYDIEVAKVFKDI